MNLYIPMISLKQILVKKPNKSTAKNIPMPHHAGPAQPTHNQPAMLRLGWFVTSQAQKIRSTRT